MTNLNATQRERMIQENLGLVKHIARRMCSALPAGIDADDLVQEGNLGLLEALDRFEPQRGIRFSTFAATRVRGAILDWLRSQDWVSRGGRRRLRDLHRSEEGLAHQLGRRPSLEEVCAHSGISRDEVERRRLEGVRGQLRSLDEARPDQGEEGPAAALADPGADTETLYFRNYGRELLLQGLARLSEREQLIMNLYYFEEFTLKEIGSVLGVTEARVCQLHSRTLRRLREHLQVHREDLLAS